MKNMVIRMLGDISEKIIGLLHQTGLISMHEADIFSRIGDIIPLQSDGSTRRFYRVSRHGENLCLAVAPGSTEDDSLFEARSALLIGRHLARRGVPVPEILGWDANNGLLLFEDLGDIRLHDATKNMKMNELRTWYRLVIDQLVHMQLAGIKGFDVDWCWDTPRYDRELMTSRESHYFLRAFWQDLLGLDVPDGIEDEFLAIATCIDGKVRDVFLYRDFQSRNIMIKNNEVRFIDFQAGRLGPPGYDLSSLLIDPYAALSQEFQDELLDYYLGLPEIRHAFSIKDLLEQYPFLALQRNLQIIGAFSFLSRMRGKTFFSSYILPSLVMLHTRLQQPAFAGFPVLQKMAGHALEAYKKQN